jgi:hypothetical protein
MNDAIETKDILIAYIRAFLHGESITIPITKDVIALAKRHQVQNILYRETKVPALQMEFNVSVARSMAQEYAMDELMEYFEAHQLYVMPLKGICTKRRYSDPMLRTMGDLDIRCKAEQAKGVQLAMQDLGYENHVEGRKHDSYSMPPYVRVEVHRDLVDGESQYFDYYQNIWGRCKPKMGCQYVYEMSIEDEYIFNLVHLVGHFKESGIGLRFLIDVYIYESMEMDWRYIAVELDQLGLTNFYQNIRSLVLYWLGTDEERNGVELTPIIQQLGKYIISGSNTGSIQNCANLKAGRGKLSSLFHSCFPGYASMKSMFPWLKPLLLPYGWILRAVRALKYRRNHVKSVWNTSMGGNAGAGKRLLQFYKSCGL